MTKNSYEEETCYSEELVPGVQEPVQLYLFFIDARGNLPGRNGAIPIHTYRDWWQRFGSWPL